MKETIAAPDRDSCDALSAQLLDKPRPRWRQRLDPREWRNRLRGWLMKRFFPARREFETHPRYARETPERRLESGLELTRHAATGADRRHAR